jgi:hypothetical protein
MQAFSYERIAWLVSRFYCKVFRIFSQKVLEYVPIEEPTAYATSTAPEKKRSKSPKVSVASLQRWHQRLGHINDEAIKHAVEKIPENIRRVISGILLNT